MARHRLADRLLDALDHLPVDQRVAFVLCEVEQRTSVEVAAILGVPEGTVRTRAFHARRRLRELLAAEDPVAERFDLDAMIDALRERGVAAPRQAETTRRRVMASLERSASGRRRRVAVIVTALTLGTGTLSWAATTGRLAPVLARFGVGPSRPAAIAPGHDAIDRLVPPHGARLSSRAMIAPALEPVPMPAPVPMPSAQPVVPAAPLPAPPPPTTRRRARPAPAIVDDSAARFRRADQLHVGGDPAAALTAWDDYLAAYPTGALALEARYNRALALVRLRRWDDARAALAPFAAGEVAPAGYRQAEAAALTDAIDRHQHGATQKRDAP